MGITALICSRAMFSFINDPEGPNLLIVVVLAVIMYALSLGIYSFKPSIANSKKLLLAILAQIVIVGGLYFFLQNHPAQNANIIVTSPAANMIIQSPFVVKGEAKGTWYFEASFPVELIDANGKVLAQTHASAKGDWMTANLVPFESKLEFQTPTTSTGTIILKKDNPSGLPANDDSVSIPVRF